MNARDILKYGDRTFRRSVDGLPETDWETGGVCGVWSVKGIVAHVAAHEMMLLDVLESFVSPGRRPERAIAGLGGRANDAEVEIRMSRPPAEVLAEYREAHARVMSAIEGISDTSRREAGTLPWYGVEYALDDYIVYANYGHKREHSAQIAVFRDRIMR